MILQLQSQFILNNILENSLCKSRKTYEKGCAPNGSNVYRCDLVETALKGKYNVGMQK